MKAYCFSVSLLCLGGGKQKAAGGAYRSARHIDAERTAAVMNVPNDVRRREGKRACSPAKEL